MRAILRLFPLAFVFSACAAPPPPAAPPAPDGTLYFVALRFDPERRDLSAAGPFPLRSWGYGDDGRLWSDPAGEYFPALPLPDGAIGIALPVREPDEGRVGFEWRVYQP